MLQFDVAADTRAGRGKGKNRQIRLAGRTPAVLYGCGVEAQSLSVDTRQVTKEMLAIQGRPAVLHLAVDGKENHYVLIRDIQVDPVTDTLKHIDFYKIDAEKPMVFSVPVEYTGTAKGVDMGGELQILLRTVKLKGKPLEIPDAITIDISGLKIHDAFFCKDLDLPDTVALMDDADTPCVRVVTAAAAAVDATEEEDVSTEAMAAAAAE